MTGLPETPEAVALFLLTLLLKNASLPREQVLGLYVECLNAAIGFRPGGSELPPAIH